MESRCNPELIASVLDVNESSIWRKWSIGQLQLSGPREPKPHVPHESVDFVVLLLFPHLLLSLPLFYIFAQLAHFRQKKTKGDCTHSKKKTAKRKGPAVDASVQEESPVVTQDGGLLEGGDVCKSTPCSNSPDRARGAFATQVDLPSVVF